MRLEISGARLRGLAPLTPPVSLGSFLDGFEGQQQLRTRRLVDGPINSAAPEQGRVGGVDDGVHLERGDVGEEGLHGHRGLGGLR